MLFVWPPQLQSTTLSGGPVVTICNRLSSLSSPRPVHTVCGKKPLPLPFNETERNGPFMIRSSSVRGLCVFAVRFESVLIKYYYILIALSALACGSLWFLLKSATRSLNHTLSLRTFFLLFLATLAKLHGRPWLQTGSRLLYTGRREALFEFESKWFSKFNLYARTVCSKCLATLSQNCTAGHGFRLDLDFFTRAGVRRYLNSNANKNI